MVRSYSYYRSPAPWTTPDLACVQNKPAPSTPLISHPRPPTKTQTLYSTARRLTSWVYEDLLSHYRKDSQLENLPPDLLLLIVSMLPDASVASLALTCKSLLSLFPESSAFRGVQLPSEQPLDFQSPQMSKPQVYQFARWEFLRFLEKDLKGTWYLCSECFTLHPPHMLTRSMVLKSWNCYYDRNSENRTCRHWRKKLCAHHYPLFAPTGIVDLCPCVKLTVGKKRQIESRLREDAQEVHLNGRPAADFWWHECRQVYGDVQVELRIGLFLYDGTESIGYLNGRIALGAWIINDPPMKGQLGALLEYRLTFPSQYETGCPRFLCPHLDLVKSIKKMLICRENHRMPGKTCNLCDEVQFCQQCRTKVHDLCKLENIDTYKNHGWILRAAGGNSADSSATPIGALGLTSSSSFRRKMLNANMVSCTFRVEKCLDGNLWPMHTVFPFARRQLPLQRCTPIPWYSLARLADLGLDSVSRIEDMMNIGLLFITLIIISRDTPFRNKYEVMRGFVKKKLKKKRAELG